MVTYFVLSFLSIDLMNSLKDTYYSSYFLCCFAVAPIIKVPNQLLGAPLGTDVQLECHVEAYPNTINYWVKNRGEMLLDG